MSSGPIQYAQTPVLSIAYHEYGASTGWPVVLSHGFPYDPHAYDHVVPSLIRHGARVIVPYLRGYGPTRFLSPETMRNGQQAALGRDIIDLLDALGIEKALLAGFDWGGLASCCASALFPDRVVGLVSIAGYDINDVSAQLRANPPFLECRIWYQHLFQSERGRECLEQHRRDLCKILWKQWSPNWPFSEELYDSVADSFGNPDFVDVVIHCYRHCFGNAQGESAYEDLEERLRQRPKIVVPTITIDGIDDPLKPGGTAHHAEMFTGKHEHRAVKSGHALPFEAPEDFAAAILAVHDWVVDD
ncbi:Alpha/Beta hydrolase protein [Naematelia encephala]|uniref:Alpha/Beta hydrolase protein n=1 Tax=Naematelia encephala TaxID=71784 RepID=A0A1Y2ASI6_9TREE|nr:Alpha/Beta hydrolase protein [Naematelia encephala]